MWHNEVDSNNVTEIRLRNTIYLGNGAISKIADIAIEMKKNGISKVLCVTGRGAYKKTGAWDYVVKAFADNDIAYFLYDKAKPNPTVDQVDEAAALGVANGVQAVLGIGGGSPIDTAKSAAILLANTGYNARELYNGKFAPVRALPIVAINLTHGTGTEANRFAVASIPETEHKPAIAYDCIYPWYSIDDPSLMVSLSEYQTRSTAIDAVNHVVEAATTKVNSPLAIEMARETIANVAKYLPAALEDPTDTTARYWLTYAAMIAGACFDNGLLHITHALEHPLSALHPEFTHGAGLGMLLPAVVEEIYPAKAATLKYIFQDAIPELKAEADFGKEAAEKIEKWLFSLGLTEKLEDDGFKESDIEKLTELAFTTPSLDMLLGLSPVEMTRENVAKIYRNSLQPVCK